MTSFKDFKDTLNVTRDYFDNNNYINIKTKIPCYNKKNNIDVPYDK